MTTARIGLSQANRILRQLPTGLRLVRVERVPSLQGINWAFAVVPLRRSLQDADVTARHVVAWGNTIQEAVENAGGTV